MDVPVPQEDSEVAPEAIEPSTIVTSHEPRPGKLVFTERDNTDGWIATDVVVDLEP